jgi:hypothetical protein
MTHRLSNSLALPFPPPNSHRITANFDAQRTPTLEREFQPSASGIMA